MPLIECVPNFSEGRRQPIIEAIVAAIREGGVHLLDVSSDADHNRTVVTFAGEPDTVAEAAFRGCAVAAQHIDLRTHSGQHPRIGATDVLPFIPLRAASMADCVALVRRVGARIGAELGLPVYLYGEAATDEARRSLADLRRGQYEGLAARLANEPAMQPDFGPSQVGPAGAVAVGARGPLIAYNAYLDSSDVALAKQIARRVRASSGGLPAVKAIGLLVNGQAQVSMNLTDFRQTSLFTVMNAVYREAAALDVVVTHTELVGVVPQAALIDAALAYLRLPAGVADMTLEKRLGQALNDYRQIPFE